MFLSNQVYLISHLFYQQLLVYNLFSYYLLSMALNLDFYLTLYTNKNFLLEIVSVLDPDLFYIEDLNSDDNVDVEIVATGENLFSIMFTSGTTGLPKGVKVTNHQLAGLFESFKNIFSFSYGDLIGCYLSFSFIASYVIFLAFAFGGGCRIFVHHIEL